jgi:hypothetical protein
MATTSTVLAHPTVKLCMQHIVYHADCYKPQQFVEKCTPATSRERGIL